MDDCRCGYITKVKEETRWVERSIKDRLQYTIHHVVVPWCKSWSYFVNIWLPIKQLSTQNRDLQLLASLLISKRARPKVMHDRFYWTWWTTRPFGVHQCCNQFCALKIFIPLPTATASVGTFTHPNWFSLYLFSLYFIQNSV